MGPVTFKQFEQAYDRHNLIGLEEGAISSLKNYLSRLFGGKISKLDAILKKYREHESDYWSEWADNNFQYNSAKLLYDQAKSAIVRGQQNEIMLRVKKAIETLDMARGEYKRALEKQASVLIGSSERLKDYYDMKRAEADTLIAQESYEEVKKLSDEKVIDALYKNLEQSLSRSKQQDDAFREKYGDAYKTNYFGMSDAEMSGGHSYLGKRVLADTHDTSSTLNNYINMDDRVFASIVHKMSDSEMDELADDLKDELDNVKNELNKLNRNAETVLGNMEKDKQHASWKQERDKTSIHSRELNSKKKRIANKLALLMTISKT